MLAYINTQDHGVWTNLLPSAEIIVSLTIICLVFKTSYFSELYFLSPFEKVCTIIEKALSETLHLLLYLAFY